MERKKSLERGATYVSLDSDRQHWVTFCQVQMEKKLILKALSNLAVIVILGLVTLLMHLFAKPFQRGFYCNDESISYPFANSTVPFWLAVLIGGGFWIVCVLFGEARRYRLNIQSANDEIYADGLSFSKDVAVLLVAVTRWIFLGVFGHLFVEIITYSVKLWVGRQRPHFLAVCQPNKSSPLYNCSTYIPASVCQIDDRLVEAQVSFPSGHASFAMYAAVWACVYLQSRVRCGGHLIKPTIQLAALLWGVWVCMSRISDYKHHWSDVLAGGLLGSAGALLIGLKFEPTYLNCYHNTPSLMFDVLPEDGSSNRLNEVHIHSVGDFKKEEGNGYKS